MEEKEFNLSEKRMCSGKGITEDYTTYKEKDIKEFIKRLKRVYNTGMDEMIINKLAGDKLI